MVSPHVKEQLLAAGALACLRKGEAMQEIVLVAKWFREIAEAQASGIRPVFIFIIYDKRTSHHCRRRCWIFYEAVLCGRHPGHAPSIFAYRGKTSWPTRFKLSLVTGATINGNFSTVTLLGSRPNPFSSERLNPFIQK